MKTSNPSAPAQGTPLNNRSHESSALFAAVMLVCLSSRVMASEGAAAPAAPTPLPQIAVEENLRVFVHLASRDAALSGLLSKHSLMLQYSVSNLDLNFHLGFANGRIVGNIGPAPRSPELGFVSDAATLERVLKGEDGGPGMQMTLHLGLLRRLELANDLKAIRASLARVYKSACEKVAEEKAAGPVLTQIREADLFGH